MTASIDAADLIKIARAAGESGKPEPEFAASNPKARAAYRAGAGLPDDTPTDDAPATTPKPPVKHPQSHPSGKSGGTRSPGTRSRAGRGTAGRSGSRKRSSSRPNVGAKISRTVGIGGGTGGGLLLAIFAYPLGLSILKNGPSGAGLWLKAKFLNQAADPATNPLSRPALPGHGQSTDPNAPGYVNPKAKPGTPGSGKWPSGVPIPGQPQPSDGTPS